MKQVNKIKRWEIEDLTKKGYRAYSMSISNKEYFSKFIYHRYGLDNFFMGDVLFVKNRRTN